MRQHSVSGGTYAEATADGRWIAQTGETVRTNWGDVPAPGTGVLTARLSPVFGSHRICGHEHDDTHIVVYESDQQWHVGASTISGAMSAAFGPTGRLYWAPDYNSVHGEGLTEPLIEGHEVAAGGIRHIVTGPHGEDLPRIEAYTYFDPARRIWEYTEIGDVTVGQAENGGVLVLYGDKRYVIDSGFCWYVRFNRDGDQLAIAYWKLHENIAKFVWCDVAELSLFPQESPEEPEEPQEPEEPEHPEEPEEPEEPEVITIMNVYRYPQDSEPPDNADGLIPYYRGSKYLIGKRVASPRADVAARGGYGILKPNGKWASLNPDGGWEERDGIPENLRSWETFFDAIPGMSAPREKSSGVWESYQFNTRMAE